MATVNFSIGLNLSSCKLPKCLLSLTRSPPHSRRLDKSTKPLMSLDCIHAKSYFTREKRQNPECWRKKRWRIRKANTFRKSAEANEMNQIPRSVRISGESIALCATIGFALTWSVDDSFLFGRNCWFNNHPGGSCIQVGNPLFLAFSTNAQWDQSDQSDPTSFNLIRVLQVFSSFHLFLSFSRFKPKCWELLLLFFMWQVQLTPFTSQYGFRLSVLVSHCTKKDFFSDTVYVETTMYPSSELAFGFEVI